MRITLEKLNLWSNVYIITKPRKPQSITGYVQPKFLGNSCMKNIRATPCFVFPFLSVAISFTATSTELVHSAANQHSGNLWKFLECSSYFVSEFKEISYTASHLLHPSSLIVLKCRRNGPFQIDQILNILSLLFHSTPIYPLVTVKKLHSWPEMVTEKWMQQHEIIIHLLIGWLNITTSIIKHHQDISANKEVNSGYSL